MALFRRGLVQKRFCHTAEAHRDTPVIQPAVASTMAEKEGATEVNLPFWFSFPPNKTQVCWVRRPPGICLSLIHSKT